MHHAKYFCCEFSAVKEIYELKRLSEAVNIINIGECMPAVKSMSMLVAFVTNQVGRFEPLTTFYVTR